MEVTWQHIAFNDLTAAQMHAILAARCEVFIVEQKCAFQDIDDLDKVSSHLIAWSKDGRAAAYLRIVSNAVQCGKAGATFVHSGRIAIAGTGWRQV